MIFPDFLGIGAQRAGSSWLYVHLRSHPELWLPPIKEVHFFDWQNHQTGVSAYPIHRLSRQFAVRVRDNLRWARHGDFDWLLPRNLLWDFHYFLGRRNLAWYQSLFAGRPGKLRGEITPDYGPLSPDAIRTIQGYNPELKIIFVLRDPIDRSWSAAVKGLGRDRQRPAATIPARAFLRRFNKPAFRLQSDYLRTLANWEQFFPPQQFHIAFMEELENTPADFLRRLFEFLGVDPSAAYSYPGLQTKVNSTGKYKSAIPADLEYYLATQYHDLIRRLAERFDGPPKEWLARADRILSSPPPDSGLVSDQ